MACLGALADLKVEVEAANGYVAKQAAHIAKLAEQTTHTTETPCACNACTMDLEELSAICGARTRESLKKWAAHNSKHGAKRAKLQFVVAKGADKGALHVIGPDAANLSNEAHHHAPETTSYLLALLRPEKHEERVDQAEMNERTGPAPAPAGYAAGSDADDEAEEDDNHMPGLGELEVMEEMNAAFGVNDDDDDDPVLHGVGPDEAETDVTAAARPPTTHKTVTNEDMLLKVSIINEQLEAVAYQVEGKKCVGAYATMAANAALKSSRSPATIDRLKVPPLHFSATTGNPMFALQAYNPALPTRCCR